MTYGTVQYYSCRVGKVRSETYHTNAISLPSHTVNLDRNLLIYTTYGTSIVPYQCPFLVNLQFYMLVFLILYTSKVMDQPEHTRWVWKVMGLCTLHEKLLSQRKKHCFLWCHNVLWFWKPNFSILWQLHSFLLIFCQGTFLWPFCENLIKLRIFGFFFLWCKGWASNNKWTWNFLSVLEKLQLKHYSYFMMSMVITQC